MSSSFQKILEPIESVASRIKSVLFQKHTQALGFYLAQAFNGDYRLTTASRREVTMLEEIIPTPHFLQDDLRDTADKQLFAVLLYPCLPAQGLLFVGSKGHGRITLPN
jgi:hypothetical protein